MKIKAGQQTEINLINLPSFNLEYIEQELQKAPYDKTLGIRRVPIASMDILWRELILIAVKIDPGRQLTPHLHEIDGEICIPLSEGSITLGKALRDKNDNYKKDHNGKILVKWNMSQKLVPGKPIEIDPGIPHHLFAPSNKPLTAFFILPASHLETDKIC